jgi:MerR family transcriptional regulator, copper efflux regulator
MVRDGLLIGEVATKSGTSRKALRVYEAAGIIPKPRRTPSGYRLYDSAALDLVAFVRQAQRLGFTLEEIKEIISIRRSGRVPCPHVRDLVSRKATELDRTLADLKRVRHGLRALLRRWPSQRASKALVCPHIEHVNNGDKRRKP